MDSKNNNRSNIVNASEVARLVVGFSEHVLAIFIFTFYSFRCLFQSNTLLTLFGHQILMIFLAGIVMKLRHFIAIAN